MNPKTPIKIAPSKGSRLAEADRNALGDLVKGLARKNYVVALVTYKDAPEGIDVLERFAETEKVALTILQPADKTGLGRLALRKADDELPRLVAVAVDACAELGEGGQVAKECRAADLPIFTFTTKQ